MRVLTYNYHENINQQKRNNNLIKEEKKKNSFNYSYNSCN